MTTPLSKLEAVLGKMTEPPWTFKVAGDWDNIPLYEVESASDLIICDQQYYPTAPKKDDAVGLTLLRNLAPEIVEVVAAADEVVSDYQTRLFAALQALNAKIEKELGT